MVTINRIPFSTSRSPERAAECSYAKSFYLNDLLDVLVDQNIASWNRVTSWLRDLQLLRRGA